MTADPKVRYHYKERERYVEQEWPLAATTRVPVKGERVSLPVALRDDGIVQSKTFLVIQVEYVMTNLVGDPEIHVYLA